MFTYAAFLGHQPNLSIAELASVIPNFTLIHRFEKKIITFESSVPITQTTMDILGGTVLIAEQLSSNKLSLGDVPKVLVKELESIRGKKVIFALRTFGISPKNIRTLYREGKNAIRKGGRASRYVGTEKKPAATALLKDLDLTGKGGCELCILVDEDNIWMGKTIAVQNIDAYTARDMEKPVRDTTVGLLPPKLAQILINLGLWLATKDAKSADRKKFKPITGTVFDPFCGTGVIPLEAILRGCNVLASDISLKAVNGSTKNIEWLRKEMKILKKDVLSEVWKHDVKKPFALKNLPDAVVTETTLGTPFTSRPSQKDATAERKKNEEIQEAFLRNAAETMPGVPIVCTWPVWQVKNKPLYLEKIWKVIEELPYKPILPVENEFNERKTMLYRRPDQFIGREVVLLSPTE
ncbi:MAG: RsmD family RNA methyltransferase [Candidatus Peribacteraceae bacterium]|nr:RsmD family RNA methyltransferase [Candidatus Peribacteraceae bacterium]